MVALGVCQSFRLISLDGLKDFEVLKVLIWVVPGAMIALFRSFAMRGSFPGIAKDDVAAFLIGSVIYAFLLVLCTTGRSLTDIAQLQFSPRRELVALILVPAIVGLGLGLLEASDAVGFTFRKIGIRLPSPDATAWETVFRELGAGAVLMVTMKDGSKVSGRWVGGRGGSAASTDPKTMDLYLGEVGTVSNSQYVATVPRRGIYLVASEIHHIEIVG
jgi:Family of unknown function (DUF6338)